MLRCGVLAGPLFVVVTAVGIVGRAGFDLRRNGISQLSLGDLGWIQIMNFVLAGALTVAFAVGVRRRVDNRWAPIGIAGFGCGLIVTGLFLVDPGAGFPPGTMGGVPDHPSWHGMVHAVAPPIAFALLISVCAVFAGRSVVRRRWTLAGYCVATGIGAAVLTFWPGPGSSVRAAVAVVVTSVWLTVIALELLRETRRPSDARSRPVPPRSSTAG